MKNLNQLFLNSNEHQPLRFRRETIANLNSPHIDSADGFLSIFGSTCHGGHFNQTACGRIVRSTKRFSDINDTGICHTTGTRPMACLPDNV